MKFTRIWAMPNKWTFLIPPISKLINTYIGDGKGWIDPFAGENSKAEITNDLNPERPTKYHLHAFDFIQQLEGQYEGCLFDPPYNLAQCLECYQGIGIESMSQRDAQYFPAYIKDALVPKIKTGGIVICFGWNTNGMGKERGFELLEILCCPHGGPHNDTLVTVERKFQHELF